MTCDPVAVAVLQAIPEQRPRFQVGTLLAARPSVAILLV